MMALQPITRQEQIIAGKNLEPVTRMEMFLKEYGGASSWNDLKDKPFEKIEGEVELVSKNGFVHEEGAFLGQVVAAPNGGETYKVTYNGVEYALVAVEFEGRILFGNLSAMGIGEDTGEPFLVIIDPETNQIFVISLDNAQALDLSIKGHVTAVKKLDDIFYKAPCVFYVKYLPNSETNVKYLYKDSSRTLKATRAELNAAKETIVLDYNGDIYYPSLIEFKELYGLVNVLCRGSDRLWDYGYYYTAEYEI